MGEFWVEGTADGNPNYMYTGNGKTKVYKHGDKLVPESEKHEAMMRTQREISPVRTSIVVPDMSHIFKKRKKK